MPKSFIVNFWEIVFKILGRFSIYSLIRAIFPNMTNTSLFSEIWAFFNLIFSIVSIPIIIYTEVKLVEYIMVIYALLRIFEVTVYQINVLLFDEYRAAKKNLQYVLTGYRRVVILIIQNYFEIIFWFASEYVFFHDIFSFNVSGTHQSVFGAIYTSFVVMTSFGFYNVIPLSLLAYSLLIFQAITGLFMTLLSLSRFISLIPNPKSLD